MAIIEYMINLFSKDWEGKEKFNDLDFDLKFLGKVEEMNGNTVPYYIKISERNVDLLEKNGSDWQLVYILSLTYSNGDIKNLKYITSLVRDRK